MTNLSEIKHLIEDRPVIERGDLIPREALSLIDQYPRWRKMTLFAEGCGDKAKYDVEVPCPICGKTTLIKNMGWRLIISADHLKPENRETYLCPECKAKNNT